MAALGESAGSEPVFPDSGFQETGFRRRILIEPSPGQSRAELEDDYHRMIVTLTIADGIITRVEAEMKRSPWTVCPGAIAQLSQTFERRRIDDPAIRDEKTRNCTHLFDLASFAVGHAGASGPIAYDVEVSDPLDGQARGRIWRDGRLLYELVRSGKAFLAPADLAGKTLYDMNGWIAAEPEDLREAAKILRWAMIMSQGRGMAFPETAPPESFARSVCYNFQPEMTDIGRRRPGAHVDFTDIGKKPMADREPMFARRD